MWTKTAPNKPGWYWYFEFGASRIVKVWKLSNDSRLFTNEDAGSLLVDYDGFWWDEPIPQPSDPEGDLAEIMYKAVMKF